MATEMHTPFVSKLRQVIIVLLMVTSAEQVVAGPKLKAWKQLSRPEKVWTFFHVFQAHKAYTCATRARIVSDSLLTAGVLKDGIGGQLDAFRHAYWMALLVNSGFSEKGARHLGEKHEKGNYLQFKKDELEDSLRPDSMMSVMDLKNNDKGISIGTAYTKSDKTVSLIQMILNDIWNGSLFILSKDAKGNFLNCTGEKILLSNYRNKWSIPKCLVSSEKITVEH